MSKSRESLIKLLNQLHEQLDNLPPEIVDRLANGNPPGASMRLEKLSSVWQLRCDICASTINCMGTNYGLRKTAEKDQRS